MERAARTLTPVSLELGGKDPMIVLRGRRYRAPLHIAAVWGADVQRRPDVCVGRAGLRPRFGLRPVRRRGRRATSRSMKMGAGAGYDFGAMIDDDQVAVTERHVSDAVAAGAKALPAGRPRGGEGSFYPPTVLVDVDHSMACMTEETFGPTLPIMKVSDGRRGGPARQRQPIRPVAPPSSPRISSVPKRLPCRSIAVLSTSTT